MKIKYSPCKSSCDTTINVTSANSLIIDGELFDFDEQSVAWPDVFERTDWRIIEARRDDDGELWLTVLRFYTGSCAAWDTGKHHEVTP